MDMTYYLDTSAVRHLGSRLNHLEASERSFKSSALTISELLNGILENDKQFGRRRSAIATLLGFKNIEIEWTLPDTPLALCFTEIRKEYEVSDRRPSALKQLAYCAATSKDRDDFKTNESKLNIEFGIRYFEHYDTEFGDQLVQMSRKGNPQIRDAFEKAKAGELNTQVPQEILQAGFGKFCDWFSRDCRQLNEAITIHGMAVRAARDIKKHPEETFIARIYESYDQSIDSFVSAFSRVSMSPDAMGRNDALDLAHLLFVRPGWTLVTNDVKMRKLAIDSGLNVVTATELLPAQS